MRRLTVEKGLLRQTEVVQDQIEALVRCDVRFSLHPRNGQRADGVKMLGPQDPENELSLTAFRLLTLDLLELFKVMNEGTINVLGKLENFGV